jgi:hypothetical protein
VDIGKAFSFVFEDEEWVQKILLGALISLIPIFGQFAVMGYAIAVIRNVVAGEARPLPDWQNLGQYFVDGLMLWVATFVYALPLLILICPIALVWLLPAFAAEQEDLVNILAGLAGLMSAGLGCLAVLYGILLWLLTPVVRIRYAEAGEIGACLRFGEVFRFLFANIGGILISQLLVWAVGVVLVSAVGGLTLGLLVLPISFWLAIFSGHLYGQISRQAGEAPLAA